MLRLVVVLLGLLLLLCTAAATAAAATAAAAAAAAAAAVVNRLALLDQLDGNVRTVRQLIYIKTVLTLSSMCSGFLRSNTYSTALPQQQQRR